MKKGDLIKVKGNDPDWLDLRKGEIFPNWIGFIVGDSPDKNGRFKVMKCDGTIWVIWPHRIIEVVHEGR